MISTEMILVSFGVLPMLFTLVYLWFLYNRACQKINCLEMKIFQLGVENKSKALNIDLGKELLRAIIEAKEVTTENKIRIMKYIEEGF